jgi:predicted Zn-dependent peptidase
MGRLADVGVNWMYLGEYRTTADDVEAIKSVTVEHVCSLVKQLRPGEYTQFSIGPAKSK